MILPTVFLTYISLTFAYSSIKDDQIIRNYLLESPTDHAVVARKLVHKANWASAGTISTRSEIPGFPMVNIISIADSAKDAKSTGNIYFLLTPLDFTEQDLDANNKLTFMISDDENLDCSHSNIDPMEPTCSRAILSGTVNYLNKNESEFEIGKTAFLSRHPAAAKWNSTHDFKLCKLEITNIFVLDWYGGPHNVNPDDYYNADLDEFKLSVTGVKKLVKYLDWAMHSTQSQRGNLKRRGIRNRFYIRRNGLAHRHNRRNIIYKPAHQNNPILI